MKLSEHLSERPLRDSDLLSLVEMSGVVAVEPIAATTGDPEGVIAVAVWLPESVIAYGHDPDEQGWEVVRRDVVE